MIEMFKKKRMDVLGVQETHMRGSGMLECKMGKFQEGKRMCRSDIFNECEK